MARPEVRAVLPRSFYDRPTLVVARELLGAILVHDGDAGRTAARIVEVEAYVGESDPGCHAAAGLTARNQPLYDTPGRAYVYLNYGVHCLLNAVTEGEGQPAAVLIRAAEPIDGLDLMRERRRRRTVPPDHALCQGPGNLARAFGITLQHNRRPLDGALRILAGGPARAAAAWTRRIGLSRGGDHYWRAVLPGSRSLSGTRAWNADTRSEPWPAQATATCRSTWPPVPGRASARGSAPRPLRVR